MAASSESIFNLNMAAQTMFREDLINYESNHAHITLVDWHTLALARAKGLQRQFCIFKKCPVEIIGLVILFS